MGPVNRPTVVFWSNVSAAILIVGTARQNTQCIWDILGWKCRSLENWHHFATNIVGVPVSRDADGTLGLRLDGYARRFIITEGSLDSLSFAGFELADRDAFEAYSAGLLDHGVAVYASTAAERARRKVEDFAWFNEPSGLRYEIYYGPERADTPFSSDLIRSGFVTDPRLGIGHMLIQTADLAESEDFYTRGLGFKITNRGDVDKKFKAIFVRSDDRHHSVAICEFQPELPVSLPNSFAHLMVEVASMEDVGMAYERAVRHGVPITQGLGRHPDGIFSFYCRSPSGFEFEIGAGSVIVDNDDWPVDTYHETSDWGHFAPDGQQLGKPEQPASARF